MTHHRSFQPQGHEAAQLHLLMAQLLELTERVTALERALYPTKTVRGWDAAARVLDSTARTLKRHFKTDPTFPRPIRVRHLRRGMRPEWPLSALLNYKTAK